MTAAAWPSAAWAQAESGEPGASDAAEAPAERPAAARSGSGSAEGSAGLGVDPSDHALDEVGLSRELWPEDLARGDESLGPLVLGLVVAGAVLALVLLFAFDVIRPGSFARAGPRDVSSHGIFIWLFAAFVTIFSGAVGAEFARGIPALTGPLAVPLRSIAVGGLGFTLSGGTAAIGMATLLRGPKGTDGAGKAGLRITVRDPVYAAIAALLAAPILLATSLLGPMVYRALRDGPPDQFAHQTLYAIVEGWGTTWGWLVLIGPVIGAPIVEELAFRGFLQSAVLRLVGKAWVGIVLVSIVFTAFHIPVIKGQWHALATLFVLSLILGISFERTKRIGVPILLHALFNLGNVLLAVRTGLG